ncbi:type II toxin-antitoxin system PemK/MazF family toxin [Phycicoccus sonneratiae]|uniref:Type II toxin-antitoxin system PemK/MazF family toxin n=1 Tax=Phycicoccus sonneratiae TaxID=2807628 RepID=A0ABS2CGC9_9MICO|nr:type II toxin-antitoxin system PemK/MazF family toxin [Phycicoccus sonneraticus]MBM6398930.1 type II toxin-antitoxin system PemK/MazF family toxin [Phycicoccus sonneraticus]
MQWQRVLRPVLDTARRELARATRRSRPAAPGPADAPSPAPSPPAPPAPPSTPRRPHTPSGYPGDHTGSLEPEYDPHPDGRPDPGEIVWTWVPYEEDHTQGKDRPVLLVGRDGPWLLALQLTSKDHDRDAGQERAAGRLWVDIGSGPWDARGRPSEVRVNRVVRVDPAHVRREGAVLPRDRFDAVAAAVRAAR